MQSEMRNLGLEVDALKQDLIRASQSESPDQKKISRIEDQIQKTEAAILDLQKQIPESWDEASKRFANLDKAEKQARRKYRSNVDQAYETIAELREVIDSADALAGLEQQMMALDAVIVNETADVAMDRMKQTERALGKVAGTSSIKTKLSRARRALRGKNPKPEKAAKSLSEGVALYTAEVDWRQRAAAKIAPALKDYDHAIRDSIGLRQQRRLSPDQVKAISACRSVHRDFSLQF